MRLTTVILIASFLQVSASTFGQRITIFQKNIPLESVLKEIRKQSGFDIYYDGKTISADQKVNVSINNLTVDDAVKQALSGLNLSYEIDGYRVTIKKKEPSLLNKLVTSFSAIDIRGRVVDENGAPLVGASVMVQDSPTRTSTDQQGEFVLRNIEENTILIIAYVGYQPVEIRAKQNIGTVKMVLTNTELSEVNVVFNTGYQSISRERSAGSFTKPNLDIMKNRSSSTNLLQRLDGLVPGLTINNAPGGEPLLIRGLTSINSSRSPLIVVDGIQVDKIENVNVQDVDDITILKDATAASIWGAKAANGVIVITTKKGQSGEKLAIDYDVYYNFQGRPDRDYIPKMNSRQFITAAKEVFAQNRAAYPLSSIESEGVTPPHLLFQYLLPEAEASRKLDSLASIDNRSQLNDLFVRNAATLNHTISIAGGGKVHRFYGSVNHVNVKSNMPGEQNNLYKINLRNDFTLSKRISAYLISDLSNSVSRGKNYSTPSLNIVPYQLFQDNVGNPLTINHLGYYSERQRLEFQQLGGINLEYSPLLDAQRGYSTGNELAARIVGGTKINLFEGLDFVGTYGYNVSSLTDRTVLDQMAYDVRNEVVRYSQPASGGDPIKYWVPNEGGKLTLNNSLSKAWTLRNQLLYNQDWGKHQLSVMGGQEATSSTPFATQAIYRGWDDELQISSPLDYQTLSQPLNGLTTGDEEVLANPMTGGEGIVVRTTSYYANLGYTFNSKYTFNGSWRIDQSNLFGKAKSAQNRPVYSLGGKWAMGAEDFLKSSDWLERLDLRFTYGVTGNSPDPGESASEDIFEGEQNSQYPTGTGIRLITYGNSNLTWENTNVYNAGLDFQLFNGRLGGSIDAYLKKTTDLIGNLAVSPLSGTDVVVGNFGDIENKGVDIALNSVNVNKGDFLWNSGFTFGYNKNKLTKFVANTPTTASQVIDAEFLVGYPAYAMHVYDYAGLNASGDPQTRLSDGTVTSSPNVALAKDALYKGTTQPVWSGGLSNNFQYKNFQLGINISYQGGHKFMRDVNSYWSGVLYDNFAGAEFADRWKVTGDETRTNIPRYAPTTGIASSREIAYYRQGSQLVFNAAFAKIRDVTFAYSVPKDLLKRFDVQALSFRFQVSNLMLWKANEFGIDPEFHRQGAFGASRAVRNGQGQITIGAHITL